MRREEEEEEANPYAGGGDTQKERNTRTQEGVRVRVREKKGSFVGSEKVAIKYKNKGEPRLT